MTNPSAPLRFAPDALRRLAEELIPNPEQGLIELVKNSYDAESRKCDVYLHDVTKVGGKIVIEDQGNGMDEDDILDGFLVIGRSRKNANQPTQDLNRYTVGDKGLGRLAALRLGNKVHISSRPKKRPGVELTLEIDWRVIDKANVVEDVILEVKTSKSNKEPGVTVEIQDLKKPLTNTDVTRLTQELIILTDPFKNESDFKVSLISPEFERLEKLVKEGYFDDAEYYISANIDGDGVGKVTLENLSGEVVATSDLPLPKQAKYDIPASKFELWIFIFGPNFSTKKSSVSQVKSWVKQVGGVHVYHRNIRVRPYGDPGYDWLDMNLSRTSHPEFRPSTNTVIGRVITKDPDLLLKQPTSRIGFVEDHTFLELKRFAKNVLRWVADYRLKEAEKKREVEKKEVQTNSQKAIAEIQSIIRATVPKESLPQVEKAIETLTKAQENVVISLREDLQLYRSLATAGTTSAVFAHEAAKPLNLLKAVADTIERRGIRELGATYGRVFYDSVSQLKSIYSSLNIYSEFPLYHLKKAKRKSGPTKISQVWEETTSLFRPLLGQAKIDLEVCFEDKEAEVIGSVALFEAIATNLVTNSVYVLTKPKARTEGRKILIKSYVNDNSIKIIHSDNGQGITIDIESIWLPGVTTNTQGTGFGLTIVRDSVMDIKGKIGAIAKGELGGAEFILEFPLFKQ